ncbi:hypothetical protein Tco_0382532 [Tanacetum coccineum]
MVIMWTRWNNIEGVKELKRNVRIKGVKKEALHTTLGKGYHTKRQKTKQEMTKPGTEWKSCEGQSQIKAKDQKSQSQSQLNKLTVKTGAVIEEYYWMQSQPI